MKKKLPRIIMAVICVTVIFIVIFRNMNDKEKVKEEFDIARNLLIYNGESVEFDDYKITLLYESRDNKSDSNYYEFLVSKNGGKDKLDVNEFRKASYGLSFCKRFSFGLDFMCDGALVCDSRLKQIGNDIIISSQMSFESIKGEIDESEVSFSVHDALNREDKTLLLLSYLDCVSGKDDNGTEVYISSDSIQLISLSDEYAENLSIELLYGDGSKKQLMEGGKSEYLAGFDKVNDNKTGKYYYKWDFIKLEEIKDIVKVNVINNMTLSSWTMDVEYHERTGKVNDSNESELIKMRKADIDEDTLVINTDIIYADEQVMMFSDYYGLVICTENYNCIRATLDLNYLGCNCIQGKKFYDIQVSEDGETVYLYPDNENVVYIYDWKADVIKKKEYMNDFTPKNNMSDKKEINSNVSMDKELISPSCIKLDNNKKMYLSCKGGRLKNLKWVIEDENGNKDSELIFRIMK